MPQKLTSVLANDFTYSIGSINLIKVLSESCTKTNSSLSLKGLGVLPKKGKDLGTWGPRPENCQKMYDQLLKENASFEIIKTEIQTWYNINKGKELQKELEHVLSSTRIKKFNVD
ncbi:hypothetical protein RM549_10885 [Salegentibacter sp. F188]|uniref:Uncharacterized protein n=1 Tax=Autumnicola patrickiae TaxID=3075591 RepID=A0ABU3E2T7_9FLAO|nr:hypothetical protein [Salegentibacter sp. F188]MDT0690292.1 hypothetical protein [Salegentibacter sp. F188]